ncbi:MAG: hypothetical protein Kow00107_01940 [Planctomycetota bacterium]
MSKWIGRIIFLIACSLLYLSYYYYFTFVYKTSEGPFPIYIAPIIGLVSGILVMVIDLLYREKVARNFFAVFIGLVIGVVFSELIIKFLERFLLLFSTQPGKPTGDLSRSPIVPMIPIIYLFVSYMSVTVILNAKETLRFIIPFVSLKDESRFSGGLILDSSVLIDGRVLDLCRSKIIDTKVVIPRFVIAELQAIADSSNKLKRIRGRRGLDIVKKLQGLSEIEIEVSDKYFDDPSPVDEKLVKVAAAMRGKVVTNDFNLNKVAQIHGVEVVNINEIASAMKTSVVIGEPIEVEIIREGEAPQQGVGYLADGTMVVVDGAKELIGQKVTATVTNIYHKDAGRIIFAKV